MDSDDDFLSGASSDVDMLHDDSDNADLSGADDDGMFPGSPILHFPVSSSLPCVGIARLTCGNDRFRLRRGA